ncbi:hypothetical protein [Melissospora conviva]|uniref:hypothetical protein n=1 Tax=Melissospora conviva TaxID=3388432 RepID=UPI003C1DD9F1
MPDAQLMFTLVGTALTTAGLLWTITWAIKTWRRSGPEIIAEIGQGYVDDGGILRVFFQDGRSKIIRVEGDPWGRRQQRKKTRPRSQQAKVRGRKAAAKKDDPPQPNWTPVNSIFVRNRGRSAISITRCTYSLTLSPTREFAFEPQPAASPWGDVLPKRIEPGDECILLHDKEEMSALLNGVMRDAGVFQSVYGIYLELGDGSEVFAAPPIMVQAWMNDSEYAEVSSRIYREEFDDEPEFSEPNPLIRHWHSWRRSRNLRNTLVEEDDIHPDDLRAARRGTLPEASPIRARRRPLWRRKDPRRS